MVSSLDVPPRPFSTFACILESMKSIMSRRLFSDKYPKTESGMCLKTSLMSCRCAAASKVESTMATRTKMYFIPKCLNFQLMLSGRWRIMLIYNSLQTARFVSQYGPNRSAKQPVLPAQTACMAAVGHSACIENVPRQRCSTATLIRPQKDASSSRPPWRLSLCADGSVRDAPAHIPHRQPCAPRRE